MTEPQIYLIISLCCIAIITITIFTKRRDLVVRFFLRCLMGICGIYIMNYILELFAIDLAIGLNLCNALIIGLLGISGYGALYLLGIYNIFF